MCNQAVTHVKQLLLPGPEQVRRDGGRFKIHHQWFRWHDMDEDNFTSERLCMRFRMFEDFRADIGKIDECKNGFHSVNGGVVGAP